MASSPAALATAEPASATHARAQRRVNSASIEKPTPKTNANQLNTRDGRAIAALPAPCDKTSTSHPRTLPVCRQDERPDQYEHQDCNDQSPRARLYFTGDTAFGRLDVVAEGIELAPGAAHRVHPGASAAAGGCPIVGMPRPVPLPLPLPRADGARQRVRHPRACGDS